MDELLTPGAAELARRIHSGALSPVAVVEAHIQRIEKVNPYINAVITTRYAAAREEARQLEARLQQPNYVPAPLAGVPITVKDSFGVKGSRFTGGSWYHRDDIAEADAPVVQKLTRAGAIILGKTNLPDMCWTGETVNAVFGRTLNPHEPRHMVGGSSGGEGAIIAAGGSPLGLGSDVAGSLRIPAAACGIVSLKPTGGRIPPEGHMPQMPDALADWNTAGPMARRVEDLALALSILSETPVQDYRAIELQGRPVTVYIRNPIYPVANRVAGTVKIAADALAQAGMSVNDNPRPPMVRAALTYMGLYKTQGGARAFREALSGGQGYDLWSEFKAILQGKVRISLEVLFFTTLMEHGGRMATGMGFGKPELVEPLRQQFREVMQPGGVLLCPLLVTPPPRHRWTYRILISSPYTVMFNLLGFPAAVVPIHWLPNGLPLAVQVVAQPGEDEVTLAVAAELERVFGGWHMATL